MRIGFTLIDVVILEPRRDWCQSMYIKMLSTDQFTLHDDFVPAKGIVLMFHGHFWQDKYDELNEALKQYEWVLAIRTSDEENRFDIKKINHPNIKWWIQYPVKSCDYGDVRFIPIGIPDYFVLPEELPAKDIDIFLSAQDTHARRHQAFGIADSIPGNHYINRTNGFSSGLGREEYRDLALRARIMPAPSGAISPDSFRLYEALEAGALPIADDISPRMESQGFFKRLFPDAPFPIITSWTELPGIIQSHTPAKQAIINEWWTNYKESLILNLWDDIEKLCKK